MCSSDLIKYEQIQKYFGNCRGGIAINESKDNKVNILIPRRSKEEREKNYTIAIQKQLKSYIKNNVLMIPEVGPDDDIYGDSSYENGDEKFYLNLSDEPITHFPDNITKIVGTLDLSGTSLERLPSNLTRVERGSLFLKHTKIKELPTNLTYVHYDLDLNNTPLESLPDNLTVNGNLYLAGTKITELPKNLNVGGGLSLWATPLSNKYTKEQLEKMYPNTRIFI